MSKLHTQRIEGVLVPFAQATTCAMFRAAAIESCPFTIDERRWSKAGLDFKYLFVYFFLKNFKQNTVGTISKVLSWKKPYSTCMSVNTKWTKRQGADSGFFITSLRRIRFAQQKLLKLTLN